MSEVDGFGVFLEGDTMSFGFVFRLCAWNRELMVAVAVEGLVGWQSGTSQILTGILNTFGVDVLDVRRWENITAQCSVVLLGLEAGRGCRKLLIWSHITPDIES